MPVDTPAWVRDAVFYQVFPDRLAPSDRVEQPGALEPWDAPPTTHGFKGGDLYGIVAHLDRLQRLGITALYLNPIFTSASNHRYHTDDYLHVDPLLGGDEALRELIDEVHARDMRIVLDGVFNHAGRGFLPFHHVLENGHQSPYRAWFHLHDLVSSGERQLRAFPLPDELEVMVRLESEGWARGAISREILGYESWWDLPPLPKLNLDEPHLRRMMLEIAERWVRFGIDGWRLDVPEEVGADFWREFRQRVRAIRPDAYLVAEVWHPKPEWLEGDLFDAFMNYPLMDAILGFVAGTRVDPDVLARAPDELVMEPIDAGGLARRIDGLRDLYDPDVTAVQLDLLGSHDTPRLRTLCGGDLDSVRLAQLFQMTLPGAPCVYYGDEVGMEGGMDPDCRGGFPLDEARWEDPPYGWLAELVALRHASRALRDGELAFVHADGMAVAYRRRWEADTFIVVVNAGEDGVALDLDVGLEGAAVEPILVLGAGSAAGPRIRSVGAEGGRLRIELDARAGGIVQLQPRA